MTIENIALIIITAFINLAVSSFIFYRYQKKVEDSFARSMLEYQTKFVKNYEKTIEILETLHKKYVIFSDASRDLFFKEESISESESDEIIMGKLNDFWNYFRDNRIYLPEFIANDIWNIYRSAVDIASVSIMILLIPPEGFSLPSTPDWAKRITNQFNLSNDDWFLLENPRASFLTFNTMNIKNAKSLEKIYKSVAGINN